MAGEAKQKATAGAALGRALLAYMLLVVLLVTWAPFDITWPSAPRITLLGRLWDLVLNFFLFVPLGFLFSASVGRLEEQARRERVALLALGLGLLLSLVIEAGQLLLPPRYTSPWDVITNGLGAYFGALIYLTLAAGLPRRLPGHPALASPLTSLFFLLSLLLGINGLASFEGRLRSVLAPLLVTAAVLILAAIWRHRLTTALSRRRLLIVAALWGSLVMLPALPLSPWIAAVSVALAVGLTYGFTAGRLAVGAEEERRFELSTVRWVALLLGLYLALLGLFPLSPRLDGFEWAFPLSGFTSSPSIRQTIGLLEHLVAFSILGFVLAQLRERRGEALGRTLILVGLIAAASALAFQTIKGFHPSPRQQASVVEGVISILAALIGGLLYRRQLAVLQKWLAEGEGADEGS